MSSLPSLLTIDALAEYLNHSYDRIISDETLIRHGLDGKLNFVVINAKQRQTRLTLIHFKSRPSPLRVKLVKKNLFDTLLENNKSVLFEYLTETSSILTNTPPVTSLQLGLILNSDLLLPPSENNNHFSLSVVSLIDQFNVRLQYLAIPKRFYSKKDLRITCDEVMRFEKIFLPKSHNSEAPLLEWKDVLINPPQKHSDEFEDLKEAVICFIDDNNSPPKYKDMVTLLGLTKKVSKDNLRKRWNRYTRL